MSAIRQLADLMVRTNPSMTHAQRSPTVAPRLSGAGRPNLMVVDASVGDGVAMGSLLKERGYEVMRSGNGVQALKMALQVKPQYVILDITLPGMNGMDVAHALRAAFRDDIVLIAVTALGNKALREAHFFTDFDCYFRKPVDMATLLQMLPRAGTRVEPSGVVHPAFRGGVAPRPAEAVAHVRPVNAKVDTGRYASLRAAG